MCVGEGDTSRSVLLVEVCWILKSDVYGADIDVDDSECIIYPQD